MRSSWNRKLTAPALLIAVWACDAGVVTSPDPALDRDRGTAEIGVLTWNVYVGARLSDLLLVSDPTQIPVAVAAVVDQIVQNDFAQRAAAIADQVRMDRPDIISLQEVSLFLTQSPGDTPIGNPVPATDVFLDYLGILLDALAERGLAYEVASISDNFDFELPMLTDTGIDDIRLIEYDVILVRNRVEHENATEGNFVAVLPIDLGFTVLAKPSGWAAVDILFRGDWYTVVNTHLEAADIAPGVVDPDLAALQAAQLAELMGVLAGAPHPVILTGDLNSAADGSTTSTYQDLLDAGYVDVWPLGASGDGFTSNQDPTLRNGTSELFHRIDYVFLGGDLAQIALDQPDRVSAERLGEAQADRTVPDGMWPSDHAGVKAEVPIEPSDN